MALKIEGEDLMLGSEVARLFRVDPKSVTRWAARGLLPAIRTPGGHRRYRRADVERLLKKARDGTQD